MSKKQDKKTTNNTYIEAIKDEFYHELENRIYDDESRLVGCLWNNPDLYMDVDLDYEDFHHNIWGTLFFVGKDLSIKKDLKSLANADQALDNYLAQHDKCRAVFDGPDNARAAILEVMEIADCMDSHNVDYYLKDWKKLTALMKMVQNGLAVINKESLHNYFGMDIEDIYDEYNAKINKIFSDIDLKTKSYNIYDNIDENIQAWDEGEVMGMLLYGLNGFSQDFGGIPSYGVTLIGGVSNSGKSSLVRNSIFPEFIPTADEIKNRKEDAFSEKTVIFLNEEDIQKWQRELLIWIINNRLNSTMSKNVLRNGGFLKDNRVRQLLIEAKEWMIKYIPENYILIVPLLKFSTKTTIKLIKKYCALGYKNFVIDTFKMDNTDDAKVDNNTRLQLVQNMTHLYNVAKKDAENVRVICTVQLAKAYTLQRYLSQESLAESKNIIDVCGTAIFMRRLWSDEIDEGIHQVHVYKYGTVNEEVTLHHDKNYVVLFCVKTREGAGDRQCVAEVDWNLNTIKEVGYTYISPE